MTRRPRSRPTARPWGCRSCPARCAGPPVTGPSGSGTAAGTSTRSAVPASPARERLPGHRRQPRAAQVVLRPSLSLLRANRRQRALTWEHAWPQRPAARPATRHGGGLPWHRIRGRVRHRWRAHAGDLRLHHHRRPQAGPAQAPAHRARPAEAAPGRWRDHVLVRGRPKPGAGRHGDGVWSAPRGGVPGGGRAGAALPGPGVGADPRRASRRRGRARRVHRPPAAGQDRHG